MRNYFKADIHRIHHKTSYKIWLIIIYLFIILLGIFKCSDESSYADITSFITSFLPIILGIITFFGVFSDDSKAKTIQVAIGRGITRNKVIVTKVLESAFLITIYYAIVGLILTIIPQLLHTNISSVVMNQIWLDTIESILNTILYFNIGLMVLVMTMKSNLAEITYILFAFDIIPGMINIGLVTCNTKLNFPNLIPYVYQSMVGDLLKNGITSWPCIIGIALYLIIIMVLSTKLFNQKELEF